MLRCTRLGGCRHRAWCHGSIFALRDHGSDGCDDGSAAAGTYEAPSADAVLHISQRDSTNRLIDVSPQEDLHTVIINLGVIVIVISKDCASARWRSNPNHTTRSRACTDVVLRSGVRGSDHVGPTRYTEVPRVVALSLARSRASSCVGLSHDARSWRMDSCRMGMQLQQYRSIELDVHDRDRVRVSARMAPTRLAVSWTMRMSEFLQQCDSSRSVRRSELPLLPGIPRLRLQQW